jgi:UDP-N-acetyl-2-amino-2-deoxyglucuronate dehydrogenase
MEGTGSIMETLRTAIVGCGKVGHLHAKGLSRALESRFVAACGRDLARTEKFAAEYHVKAYCDFEEMIAREGVQALTICTPHPLHALHAIKAAQAGVHALIEKPLASSLEDCDAILQAAKAHGVKIGMISQRRFYAACARVKKAIEDGKLGRPILGTVAMYGWRDEAYYRSDAWRGSWQGEGGGVLVNQAPHQLDLLHWYMGEIEELIGFWANLNHPYIEVEDTAVAVLRFKNGALGNIVVSNSQNPALYGRVNVHGSNGASVGVQTDGGAMFIAGMTNITEPPVNDLWTVPGDEELLKEWRKEDAAFFQNINPVEYYHQLQISEFLKAVMAGRDSAIPGEEGRKTVEIFEALYRSQRDRVPIKFPLKPEAGQLAALRPPFRSASAGS